MTTYAFVGKTAQIVCDPWLKPAGAIEMLEPSPSPDAIAQADGTWLVPAPVDISMVEADNLKAMFPASYPGILAHIGMGDVV